MFGNAQLKVIVMCDLYSIFSCISILKSCKLELYCSGSNAGVSEPGFLNFFARDVWRALSVLSITMKR